MYNIIKKFNLPDELCKYIFYFYSKSKHKKQLINLFLKRDIYSYNVEYDIEILSFKNKYKNTYTRIINTLQQRRYIVNENDEEIIQHHIIKIPIFNNISRLYGRITKKEIYIMLRETNDLKYLQTLTKFMFNTPFSKLLKHQLIFFTMLYFLYN